MTHQKGPNLLSLARNGLATRPELLLAGLSADAIKHAVRSRGLFPIWPGVYAVGTPAVTKHGLWTGAVLACGDGAALSHAYATALWDMGRSLPQQIEISVPLTSHPRGRGLKIHRRTTFEVTERYGIPVTTPRCTSVAMARRLSRTDLEGMIGQADLLGLITPVALRAMAGRYRRRPGASRVVATLERRAFRLTRSNLERLF